MKIRLSLLIECLVVSKTPNRAKRHPLHGNKEELMLEAKKRELLSNQDWVGLAPSHPVNMHFGGDRDKHKFGKRRKIDGRRRAYHNHTDCDIPASLGARAVRKDVVADISVRIGSDAFASQTQMQPPDHAASHAVSASRGDSSDPMLFDHEDLCGQSKGSMQSPRSVSKGHETSLDIFKYHIADSTDWSKVAEEQNDTLDLRCRRPHPYAMLSDSCINRNATSCDRIQWFSSGDEGHRPGYACSHDQTDEADPVDDIAQPVTGNNEGSVRIMLDGSPVIFESKNARSQSGSTDAGNGDILHVNSPNISQHHTNEGIMANCTSQFMDVCRPEKSFSSLRRVVDDAPWKTFLGIRDVVGSSNSKVSCTSQSSLDGSQLPVAINSQQATLGDMYMTTPSVTDEGARIATGRQNEELSHGMDASEKLWRTFVFADDDNSRSESIWTTPTKRPYGRPRTMALSVTNTDSYSNTWIPRYNASEDVHDEAGGVHFPGESLLS